MSRFKVYDIVKIIGWNDNKEFIVVRVDYYIKTVHIKPYNDTFSSTAALELNIYDIQLLRETNYNDIKSKTLMFEKLTGFKIGDMIIPNNACTSNGWRFKKSDIKPYKIEAFRVINLGKVFIAIKKENRHIIVYSSAFKLVTKKENDYEVY